MPQTIIERCEARGLRLTSQGAALLPELRQGFELMAGATDKAMRQHGVIRLRAPTCAMRWLVPRLVALEQLLENATTGHKCPSRSVSRNCFGCLA